MKKSVKTLLLVLCVAMALASSLLFVACGDNAPAVPVEGPETGVYYNDDGASEYTLTLSGGNTFTLVYKDKTETGDYTLSGESLTLALTGSSAKYKGNTIELTYDENVMTFYKKVNFTVAFDSKGGSAVESKSVLNGKTVDKPVNPVYANHVFIGWYSDSECTNAYVFGSRVTSNITLYAKWVAVDDSVPDFVISFDANYEGAAAITDTMTTVGGKLFGTLPDAPAAPDGFTFGGWWVSTTDNGNELSYPAVAESTVFEQNTTLYAKWNPTVQGNKLATPSVYVTSTGFAWDRVANALNYSIKITLPGGGEEDLGTVGANVTSQTYSFTQAGNYIISVVANAANPANNSAAGECHYTANALAKVSVFTVNGNVLTWNAVPNAEKYLVTVVCGDQGHDHTDVAVNKELRQFDFSNCEMTADGIVFTVKATATDYVTSESTYTVLRNLSAVTDITYDDATAELTWSAVANATEYTVVVKKDGEPIGDAVTVHTNSFQLKTYPSGSLTVEITPKAHGYNSPQAASEAFERAGLPTPENVSIVGSKLVWDAVGDATSYTVKFNDTEITDITDTEYDFDECEEFVNLADGTSCVIGVKAVNADGQSLYSDEITATKGGVSGVLTYADGVLSWSPALGGVESYTVSLNGQEAEVQTNSCEVAFNRKGNNVITVSAGGKTITLTVFVYEITFDGGIHSQDDDLSPVYVASGDTLDLPEPTRANYTFVGWYDSVEGAGKRYSSGESFADTADIELYARYTANKYTVTLNPGAGGNVTQGTVSVTYDSPFKFEVPTNSVTNLVFGGWYTQSGGNGTRVSDAEGNCEIWTVGGDTTVYAYWKDAFEYTENNTGYTVSIVENGKDIYNIKELTVPTSYNDRPVTQVGDVSNASGLQILNIPNTVTNISAVPLRSINGLEKINVTDAGATTPVYFSKDGVVYTSASEGVAVALYVAPKALSGEFTLADGVTQIPTGAFDGEVSRYSSGAEYRPGTQITKITIPASVTYIAPEAFAYAVTLEQVTILDPENGSGAALTIGRRAFRECIALNTVNLPARLDKDALPLTDYVLSSIKLTQGGVEVYEVITSPEYDDNADLGITDIFYGCSGLNAVNVAAGNANYSSVAGVLYSGTTLLHYPAAKEGDFTVPDSVRTIAKGAFFGTTGIENVTVHYLGLKIDELAFCNSSVKSVSFSGNAAAVATTIERYAFRNSQLATLTFADNCNVTTIGEGAFFGCSKLGSVAISKSVTAIGEIAFANCTKLTSLTNKEGASPALAYDAVLNCSSLKTIHISKNTVRIPSFVGCNSLENIVIEEGNANFETIDGVVYSDNGTVLCYCDSSKSGEIVIKSGVIEILMSAFQGNKGLTKVTIPNTVTKIGANAFAETNIREIVFEGGGSDDIDLGQSIFEDCAMLKVAKLPSRLTKLSERMFAYCTSLTTVTFRDDDATPSQMRRLNSKAFMSCSNLMSFTFEPYADITATDVFSGCSKLFEMYDLTEEQVVVYYKNNSPSYYLGGNVKVVHTSRDEASIIDVDSEGFAFYTDESGDSYLFGYVGDDTDITLPANYNGKSYALYSRAFYGNAGLESVTIPNGITAISTNAFEGCTALTSVSLSDTLTSIGENAFSGCTALKTVSFGSGSLLESIGRYAFNNCSSLTSITLPDTLKTIDENAFLTCGLSSVIIPASVTKLDRYAFKNNANLRTVEILGDVSNFSGYAFDGCNILYAKLPMSILGSCYFAETVLELTIINGTSIGSYDLYYFDSLEKLVLPETVTSISSNVESKFGTSLYKKDGAEELYYLGTATNEYYYLVKAVSNDITECTINEATKVILPGAFNGCNKLATITIPEGNTAFSVQDGIVYDKQKTKIIVVMSGVADIVIADTVTSIDATVFNGKADIKTIDIGSGVETIAAGAFGGCSSLTSVTFNSNITSLPNELFKNCTSLVSIDLSQFASIGTSLFSGCTSLTSVTFASGLTSLPNGTFTGCTSLVSMDLSQFTSVGTNVFNGCTSLTSVTFASSVSEIPEGFFRGCTSLTSMDLSEYTSIGANAFNGSGLTSVTLTACTNLGDGAFANCKSLTSVTLPEGLEYLKGVFAGCSEDLVITGGAVKIAEYMNNGDGTRTLVKIIDTSITEFEVPEDVTVIAESAFENNSSLQYITFADSERPLAIGSKAFKYSKIISIKLPSRLVSLGGQAFTGCSSLESVIFEPGTGVEEIGDYDGWGMFESCSSLTELVLPDGLKKISGSYCLNASKLTDITIPASVISISTLGYVKNVTLIGIGDEDSAADRFGNISWMSGKNIIYDENAPKNYTETSDENAVYRVYDDGRVKLVEWTNTTVTEAVIGEDVTDIASGAFDKATNITKIVVNANMTAITKGMFNNVPNLSEIVIGVNITEIGASAFEDMSKLQKVTFAGGGTKPLTIKGKAFRATGLKSIVLPARLASLEGQTFTYCESLTYVEFEAGCSVTSLPDYSSYGVFERCSYLKTVVMPENITSAGGYLFDNSGVTTVYLPGYESAEEAEAAFTSGWRYVNKSGVEIIYGSRPDNGNEEE